MLRISLRSTRSSLDELELSRMLELAAAALGDGDKPVLWPARGSRVIPNRQRLAAIAVLSCPPEKGISSWKS